MKSYRFLVDAVAGYAEEAAAFVRRRRLRAREFARVWRADGSIESVPADSARGRTLFEITSRALDAD